MEANSHPRREEAAHGYPRPGPRPADTVERCVPVQTRQAALDKLRRALLAWEGRLEAALAADLNKSPAESYLCEVGLTLSELGYVRRRLARWARPRGRSPLPGPAPRAELHPGRAPGGGAHPLPLELPPSSSPWSPLVGGAGGGQTAASSSPRSTPPPRRRRCGSCLAQCFPPELVSVAEGGPEVSRALLAEKFDYIFFTGGTGIGRQVMAAGRRPPDPGDPGAGGQEPLRGGRHRQAGPGRQAAGLRQAPQRRPDLRGPRLRAGGPADQGRADRPPPALDHRSIRLRPPGQ